MYERTVRSLYSMLVVALHIAVVAFSAFYLKNRITLIENYVSTMAVFLPVFGTYVGIVVGDIQLTSGPSGKIVSWTFITILSVLLLAYVLGIAFVMYLFGTGFIKSESSLPAAISVVEAAFGGFFTSLFLTLFKKA